MTSVTTDRRRGVSGALAIKVPCKAATSANITLSGEQTIDGISCADGDRVLVKSQTDGTENGIYEVDTSTWVREPDWDGSIDVVEGTIVPVSRGTLYSDTMWRVTNTGTITPGTTSITFEQAGVNDSQLVAYTPPGTGAVATTVQTKLRETISVKDFGAVGDGVTDDTSAFQAAHDSLGSSGGTIFVPSGTYLLNQTTTANQFTISKSNVTFRGDGWSSVLKHTATGVVSGNNAVVMVRPTSGDITNIILRDFRILGPTTNTGAAIFGDSRVLGIALNDGTESPNNTITDVLVEGVLIEGMETACFGVNGAGTGADSIVGCERITFSNCWARNSRQDGFNDFGGAYNYDVTLINCFATDLDGFGMEMSSKDLSIIGGVVARTGQSGIGIAYNATESPNHEVVIDGVFIHDIGTTAYPDAAGIGLGQGVSQFNTTVKNCVISKVGGYGIYAGVNDNVSIINNVIHDVGGNGTNTVGINFSTSTSLAISNNVISTYSAGYSMTIGIAIAGTGDGANLIRDNQVIGASTQDVSAATPTRIIETFVPVADFTSTGNVGAGEDDLISYTIPAYTLHSDSMGIHVVVFGTTAANANNKRVKLYLSSNVILDTTAIAANNKDWRIEAYIWRITSTVAYTVAWGDFNGTIIQTDFNTFGGQDFTATDIIKCTGEATTDDDILQKGLFIEYKNRPSSL